MKSPIQEKLDGGKKKSRNTLVAAKTTSQVQEELTQDKRRGHKLKVSIDLTSQTKSSMQSLQSKGRGRNLALVQNAAVLKFRSGKESAKDKVIR